MSFNERRIDKTGWTLSRLLSYSLVSRLANTMAKQTMHCPKDSNFRDAMIDCAFEGNACIEVSEASPSAFPDIKTRTV